MTNEQINRAVAEELGWKPVPNSSRYWYRPGDDLGVEANFTDDHNAAAEMRKGIKEDELRFFTERLRAIVRTYHMAFAWEEDWLLTNATPLQQCEAFLRMRGKWIE